MKAVRRRTPPLNRGRTIVRKRLSPGAKGRARGSAWLTQIRREGKAVGAQWRLASPEGSMQELKRHIQQQWNLRLSNRRVPLRKLSWRDVWTECTAFGAGAIAGAGFAAGFTPLPLKGSAAVVLHADASSEASLRLVLSELDRLPFDEKIIVTGEVPETWLSMARADNQTTIVCLEDDVDPDVGRALGAKQTKADIVLFVDERNFVPALILARFLWKCDNGLDVVLNDLSDSKKTFRDRNSILRIREFLNAALKRADLRMNVIGSLPFALSRKALDTIGPAELAVPAKAHAAAVLSGLSIGTGGRVTRGDPDEGSSETRAILPLAAGDHFEALGAATAARGFRLRFEDRQRNRKAVGGGIDEQSNDRHSDEGPL